VTAFIASLIFVVLAEMGDKTQLLAMAFACRYRWQTVIWAVFWATAVNHLLAAASGSYLATVVPMEYKKLRRRRLYHLRAVDLRGDNFRGRQAVSVQPVLTVAIAFFIAEMGDKTQLATIALAVKYNTVITVWMGTTLGMLISNAIGIIIGIVMGKNIPEKFMKWFAALTFIGFGIYGLYEALPEHVWSPAIVTGGIILLFTSIYFLSRMNRQKNSKPPVCEKE
jgi:putative Ca2+/H+ antiporter (TMEM165/GDT1 family)